MKCEECGKEKCCCAVKRVKELEDQLAGIVEDPNEPKIAPKFKKRKLFRRVFKA